MRRLIGTGLVGLGVFLMVAAALIRFYAYPALARVPANYESTTQLEATSAQVFNTNPKVLAPEETDLSITAHTIADSGADAPDGVAVWASSTTIKRGDGSIFQQSRERAPFDEVSGAAVSCDKCGSWNEATEGDRETVEREGQVFKFPFNTQKQTYQVWDDSVGAATPAKYAGEATVHGLKVYKFVQTIEPTMIGDQEVPGSVFGSRAPSVSAQMWYAMVRTFYVEPQTGSPVNRVEQRTQELRYDGAVVPAFTGTVRYTDAQVTTSVDDVKTNAMLLGGLQLLFPLIAFVLGLLALAGGLLLNRDRRRPVHDDTDDRDLVGV